MGKEISKSRQTTVTAEVANDTYTAAKMMIKRVTHHFWMIASASCALAVTPVIVTYRPANQGKLVADIK